MPTYEFRCPDGSIIEARFKISEVPESIPTPDGTGVATRIISGGASLLFKGSGFYITDYGKDGKKDQRAGGASSSTESAPKSDGKSDTKSESKPSTSTPSSSSAD
ncbi:zinc ribbon domain-containing protein [Gemmatimonas sp.]|jgi:predicted nucleic acid-binding Zn ribbon protein|uniref:zinc ribbon domain-containing protein n=1 Tax=Gemmatimonas sp. TaxID=1962908 RepID=UPI0037C01F75